MTNAEERRGPWVRKSTKVAYENPWFLVRHDDVIRPDGEPGTYDVIETPGPSVFVVAMTDAREVVFVRQHRYPTNMATWEVPGGNSDGEDLLDAAKRELEEETGYIATSWTPLGSWQVMTGILNEIAHAFLAQGLSRTGREQQKEDGIFDMRTVPFRDLAALIKNQEIYDGQSLSALLLASIHLEIPLIKN